MRREKHIQLIVKPNSVAAVQDIQTCNSESELIWKNVKSAQVRRQWKNFISSIKLLVGYLT